MQIDHPSRSPPFPAFFILARGRIESIEMERTYSDYGSIDIQLRRRPERAKETAYMEIHMKIHRTMWMIKGIAGLVAVFISINGCGKSGSAVVKSESTRTAGSADAVKTEETTTVSNSTAVQTTCPVMEGRAIDKSIFVEYKGVKVYFCCEGCKPDFEANPEKYLAKLPQFKK